MTTATAGPRIAFDGPNGQVLLTGTFELIGPEKARAILAQSAVNRNVKPRAVEKYARDMAAGRWKQTGEPIAIDRDGKIISGQHRLNAAIEAGVFVRFLVVRGVEPGLAFLYNSGVPSSVADELTHRSLHNAHTVSSIARLWWGYDRGAVKYFTASATPTSQELIALIEARPEIMRSASVCNSTMGLRRLVSPSIIGFVHAYVSEWAVEEVDQFVQEVATGAELPGEAATFKLRKVLINNVGQKRKLHRLEVLAVVIKAWNAFYRRKPTTTLRWRSGGPQPEAFPRIVIPEGILRTHEEA